MGQWPDSKVFFFEIGQFIFSKSLKTLSDDTTPLRAMSKRQTVKICNQH